jgi:hypothetical protein
VRQLRHLFERLGRCKPQAILAADKQHEQANEKSDADERKGNALGRSEGEVFG